jgi:hypothetical protein
MTPAEKMILIKTAVRAIFRAKALGTDIRQLILTTNTGRWAGRWFKNSATGQQTLRGIDFTVLDGGITKRLRIIEQNPDKTDNQGNLKQYASLARQGHEIAWLIDTQVSNGFLGRMQDGEWIPSRPQVVNPIQEASAMVANANPTEGDVYMNYATDEEIDPTPEGGDDTPEIPEDIGIPEWVLHELADMDEPTLEEDY